ncbi:MBL fold metallo-hydrolase [Anoxybacteroides tepidamans]|uniref:MBL fold metallo-hydrolase n=1 Tax=Anoxybacteroides tepidamans TaxID=265948 RepID=UPI000482FE44|nr:MBL fold metallo-hydrolase [Anoxybacillus tepidamans]
MKVAHGVEVLELQVEAFGQRMVFNPTLIWDEEGAVLIDTGVPGQLEAIRRAMNQAGVSFEQLKAVIITHQDIDHIGSLPAILQECGERVKVYAHALEKPHIEGERPLFKLDPNRMPKERWESLPPAMRALAENPPRAKVDEVLADHQELPYGGGIQVIFTPGHTPGHISLYLKKHKLLVAGDAIACLNGELLGPMPETTLDMAEAVRSLEKLADLDVDSVICYHGGLCHHNVKEQLRRLVEQTKSE